jgi:hypothetical protein
MKTHLQRNWQRTASGVDVMGQLLFGRLSPAGHLLLYRFDQFVTLVEFLRFRKCSENLINREDIIGGVREDRVWRMTDELNEMAQYSRILVHLSTILQQLA